jgi:hypothetical protein
MSACAYRNDLDTATADRESKAYATLAAQYALHGMELVKGDPEIAKQAPYFATRYGLWKPLECLDAARCYLSKVTGTQHGQELQAQ